MSACDKERLIPGSVMHVRGSVFILVFAALISDVLACSSQNSRPLPPPFTIFDERPFQMNCAERPIPLPPGTRSFVTVSPLAPFARTRLDTLSLSLDQGPA